MRIFVQELDQRQVCSFYGDQRTVFTRYVVLVVNVEVGRRLCLLEVLYKKLHYIDEPFLRCDLYWGLEDFYPIVELPLVVQKTRGNALRKRLDARKLLIVCSVANTEVVL